MAKISAGVLTMSLDNARRRKSLKKTKRCHMPRAAIGARFRFETTWNKATKPQHVMIMGMMRRRRAQQKNDPPYLN